MSTSSRRPPPPYPLLQKWLSVWLVAGSTRIRAPYDDVVDVLRDMIAIVPVDEAWYLAQYPGVARHVAKSPDETAAWHFWKHGYFEGLRPFADGWRDLPQPPAFAELRVRLNVCAARGQLFVDLEQTEFFSIIQRILTFVSVDERWYRNTYPAAAKDIAAGRFPSAAEHYVTTGYFQGLLPADVDVDEDWYVARYDHVRNGLAKGYAKSAKDHFTRIGYGEGCRPTQY